MEITILLPIVALAIIFVLNLSKIALRIPFSISEIEYVNVQLKYQLLLLSVSMMVLGAMFLINGKSLSYFFSLGNLAAPVNSLLWSWKVHETITWIELGIILCVVITTGTSIFMYINFRKLHLNFKVFFKFAPWVLLFSSMNSFSEEVIFRLGIIIPLNELLESHLIALISAILFGIPHLRGMPNGIIGAVMAGFMGWLLAMSILDTHGIFWAWIIHFVQDLIIFTIFVLLALKHQIK